MVISFTLLPVGILFTRVFIIMCSRAPLRCGSLEGKNSQINYYCQFYISPLLGEMSDRTEGCINLKLFHYPLLEANSKH